MRNLFTLITIFFLSACASAQVVPNASIVTNVTRFCTGSPITYSAVSAATNLSYTWAVIPSKGLSSFTDLNSANVTLTFSGSATYSIFLNVTDGSGTTFITYTIVNPARSAKASFNASLTSTGYPVQLVLTNYSTNNLKNFWTFDGGSIADTSYNLVKDYTGSGNHSVKLVVTGTKGCSDSASYDFRISDSSSVTLPNVFTPNGDGNNDVYIPLTRGITSLNAWVYNRNGILVSNWNKPKGGWDGYTTSGEECSEGVYFIVLEAFGFDGQIYKLKGNITLIR